jgi:hypothetical protein
MLTDLRNICNVKPNALESDYIEKYMYLLHDYHQKLLKIFKNIQAEFALICSFIFVRLNTVESHLRLPQRYMDLNTETSKS